MASESDVELESASSTETVTEEVESTANEVETDAEENPRVESD